jgi:hypothetical protein
LKNVVLNMKEPYGLHVKYMMEKSMMMSVIQLQRRTIIIVNPYHYHTLM